VFPRKRERSTGLEGDPNEESRAAGHPGATVATNDEELCDIEHVRIVRRWRTTCGQHEPCDSSAISDEKREPAFRLGPVERKLVVAEASIGTQLYERECLTEIVNVQLEKIRQQRGITRRSHIENDFLRICHVEAQ
jgi:hypothetical protein